MKRISLIALTIMLAFVACKKDSNKTKSNSIANGTIRLTFSTTGNPSGTYNGILFDNKEVVNSNGTGAFAIFFSSPISFQPSLLDGNIGGTAIVNVVYFNGVKFEYNSYNHFYRDSAVTLSFPPAKWVVSGNIIIPSFTYVDSTALPLYNGGINFPTSVVRTQDLTVSIVGASEYDQVQLEITDADGLSTSVCGNNGANSLTILQDSLTKLSASGGTFPGYIGVSFIKYNAQTIGGKNFLFGTITSYGTNIAIQ